MTFVHSAGALDDTIVAVATPPGDGGVAIIRLSGKRALAIGNALFSGDLLSYKSHTLHYGTIHTVEGEALDEGLCAVFLGGRSYTGEDTVEFNCHGGSLITRDIVDAALKAGARAAGPGEFTQRAFLNGKIDLAQAEAVQELIGAKNRYALAAAEEQLKGSLSTKVSALQKKLLHVSALLEAWVDFPDEDLELTPEKTVVQTLEQVAEELEALIASYHDGKIAKEGITLCLVGAPNVGKSSLMNALLDKERAIVTEIPGTTRDLLEEELRLGGLNFRLIDTAGIRITDEIIEKEGIRRSKEAMERADLILYVLDASRASEMPLQDLPKEKTLVVWNKSDLCSEKLMDSFPHSALVSAKEKTGLGELKKEIESIVWKSGPPSHEEILVTNIRHKEALEEAFLALKRVQVALLEQHSPEFISQDMRSVLAALGKILGHDITEDILSEIFSTFCIGK